MGREPVELVRNIALAALLFLIFVVLTSGRGFGSTDNDQPAPKRVEDEAAQKRVENEAAPRRLGSEDARKAAEIERVRAAEARKRELDRLCRTKPVMSDGDIASCRVAYRQLGEASK